MPTSTSPRRASSRNKARSKSTARSHAAADAPAPDSSWMTAAACTHQPDLPWIGDADSTTSRERLAMAAVCAGCPAVTACDQYATNQDMTGGFWAGTPRDLDTPAALADPGWTINPLPGLDTLDTLGGVA